MANNIRGANSWFVQTSSSSADATSYLTETNLRLVSILFTADAVTDVLNIYDKNPNSASVGLQKISIRGATAKDTKDIDLSLRAITFPNGVWVTLTGNPTATLTFTQSK